MRARNLIAAVMAGMLVLGMCACGASGSGTVAAQSQEAVAEQPADLIGSWKQTNSSSEDSAMEATITEDTIEINWVSSDSTSLYWKGTYEAPTEAGDWKWTSDGDRETMQSALLASQDSSKEFSYSADDEELIFEASALGTTATIRMSKQ